MSQSLPCHYVTPPLGEAILTKTEDAADFRKAFVERRPPEFKGR